MDRSRSSSKSGAPGASPSTSASSIVAGRTRRSSTRAPGVSPREAAISEKLISAFGGSPIAGAGDGPPGARAHHDPGAREFVERAPEGHPAHPEVLREGPLGREPRARRASFTLDLLRERLLHAPVAQLQSIQRLFGDRGHATIIDRTQTRENRNRIAA